jgi:hypothetical protein
MTVWIQAYGGQLMLDGIEIWGSCVLCYQGQFYDTKKKNNTGAFTLKVPRSFSSD